MLIKIQENFEYAETAEVPPSRFLATGNIFQARWHTSKDA
jgi:hypothetical protein